jgi:membrane protein required for colicin V production
MNAFDIVLIVLAGGLAFLGLLHGLVRVLLGIGALVLAFILATRFATPLGELLSWPQEPPELRRLLAYVLVFFGTLVVGAVAAFLVRKLIKAAMLGWVDRLAGASLGLVAATLFSALIVLPAVAWLPPGGALLRDSRLAPYVSVVADLIRAAAPVGLSESYRERIEELRRTWRERAEFA